MPELAEVEHFRKQWDPGLRQRIERVELHAGKRIFRGTDTAQLAQALTGGKLLQSEARGKQMLFTGRGARGVPVWLGLHLGMTGKMSVTKPDHVAARHEHLILRQGKRALVFQDARLFGRVLFAEGAEMPAWWAKLPPHLLSREFTPTALATFLARRKKAPIKAVLLMQERFPGIGNWMADEILWRAGIHPRQAAGELDGAQVKALYRETRWVCREALRIIGESWGDPPDSWLFNHRWQKGGTCPRTGVKLQHATIGGRTTCWSPARQMLTKAGHEKAQNSQKKKAAKRA
jgi:formamidopyrimidine-DNA glycosylase